MISAERVRIVDARHGAVTVVRRRGATTAEHPGALSVHQARELIRRLRRDGGHQCLVELHLLTGRGGRVDYRRACGRDLERQVIDATADGEIVFSEGWEVGRGGRTEGRSARAVMFSGGEKPVAREIRVSDLVMANQDERTFEGVGYLLVPASAWPDGARRDRYEVLPDAEAGRVLRRMAARARSGEDKAALTEAAAMFAPLRPANSRAGLLLLRRIQRPGVGKNAATDAAINPSQARAAVARQDHNLVFEYTTNTGEPIVDEEGFELVGPGGGVQRGKLSFGRLERRGVEPGEYELRVRAIKSASWSKTTARPSDEVDLIVEARGFPDGTMVQMTISGAHGPPDATPLAVLTGPLAAGRVSVPWRYEQPVGGSIHGDVRFEATVETKRAASGVLAIRPSDTRSVRGMCERLRALGYDPGQLSAEVDDAMRDAIRRYQEDCPAMAVTGDLDEDGLDVLDEQTS